MKRLLFTAFVGFAMVAVTGCTSGLDAKAETKCASGKCAANKAKEAIADKCAANKAKDAVAKKCASGKCGK